VTAPVDVLAVMDELIAVGREHPKDGGYYVAAWHNDTHAVMRMRTGGLGGRASGGQKISVYGTNDEATAECDRLNGHAEARAAVAELIEAAKQAKRALRSSYSEQHAAETRLRAALARVQGEGA
jgi:hypothetical protein